MLNSSNHVPSGPGSPKSPNSGRRSRKAANDKKSLKQAKDEFEFATNWQRVFTDLYIELKWLNSYGQLNEIAIQKIFKKFSKEFLDSKDGIIDTNLKNLLKAKNFTKRSQLHFLINDLIEFFA